MDEKKVNNGAKMDGEISRLLDELKKLNPDSEEYCKVVNRLDILYKLRIEETDNTCKLETEERMKKRDSLIKLGTDSAGIMLPLIFNGIWMAKGFKFEETGCISSSTFRWLIQQFNKLKK